MYIFFWFCVLHMYWKILEYSVVMTWFEMKKRKNISRYKNGQCVVIFISIICLVWISCSPNSIGKEKMKRERERKRQQQQEKNERKSECEKDKNRKYGGMGGGRNMDGKKTWKLSIFFELFIKKRSILSALHLYNMLRIIWISFTLNSESNLSFYCNYTIKH